MWFKMAHGIPQEGNRLASISPCFAAEVSSAKIMDFYLLLLKEGRGGRGEGEERRGAGISAGCMLTLPCSHELLNLLCLQHGKCRQARVCSSFALVHSRLKQAFLELT